MREYKPIWQPIPTQLQAWRNLVKGRKLVIEIGPGVGLHPIQYAINNPDKFIIGIEKTTNKSQKFIRRLENHPQLDNIIAIQANAMDWIAKNILPNEVSEYFLLYPNPYPKESQRNKRLMHMPFMKYLIATMLPNATLTIATNMNFFYQEAKESITKLKLVQDSRITGKGRTHFERKYLADNQECFEVVFAKQESYPMEQPAQDILDFWFADPKKWYAKDPEFDKNIKDKFLNLYLQAEERKLDDWQDNPHSMLALIILLDQFPRNMFRNSQDMYRTDLYAVALTHIAIERGYLSQLDNINQVNFMLMPLMHSEDLADQKLAVELFSKHGSPEAADYAVKHMVIVEEYGRFPHRNQLLQRESTPAEVEFLKQPGSSF